MQRRELLKMIALATGAAMVGGNALAYTSMGTATPIAKSSFSATDIAALTAISETIMPRTETPGATDANIVPVMVAIASDCYSPTELALFKAGLKDIDARSIALLPTKHASGSSSAFTMLTSEQQFALLSELDQQALQYNHSGNKEASDYYRQFNSHTHYFTLFKQLTLYCFFTSEVGATQVLRHIQVPGRYDGNFPYKKGDRAWASVFA